jgi:hypothetical protein
MLVCSFSLFYDKNKPLSYLVDKHGQPIYHHIHIKQDAKFTASTPLRKYNPSNFGKFDRAVKDLEFAGVIRQVDDFNQLSSPYPLTHIHFVNKPDGSVRATTDVKQINEVTVKDYNHGYSIQQILDTIGNREFIIVIDLAAAYHQVLLHPNSIGIIRFMWSKILYEYQRMAMGMVNSSSQLHMIVQIIFSKLIQSGNLVHYQDDIILIGSTIEELKSTFSTFIELALIHNLKIKLSKVQVLPAEVKILGLILKQGHISIDE